MCVCVATFITQNGLTSLYVASYKGYIEVVDTLLKNGANPNQAVMVWGLVCLLLLCCSVEYNFFIGHCICRLIHALHRMV